MNRTLLSFCCGLLLAACSNAGSESAPAAAGLPSTSQTGARADAATPAIAGRTRELVNPDHATMVLLYFDLAGLAPPIDNWVQQDGRLMVAQAADKAAMRELIRQEIEAGMASVKNVGRIRLSLNSAQLSHYDPAYGEFTVRALSPASSVSFTAWRHTVEVRFGNGRTAQVWRVPEAEAQAITDRVGNYTSHVQLDTLLEITAVQPAMSGGTLVTDIQEYELRETRGGTTLARVRVGDP